LNEHQDIVDSDYQIQHADFDEANFSPGNWCLKLQLWNKWNGLTVYIHFPQFTAFVCKEKRG